MSSSALSRTKRPRKNCIDLMPPEILTCIFICLPAKILGLCKCVAKLWNSLISDRCFIKTHVTKTSNTTLILVAAKERTLYSVRFDKKNLDGSASKLCFNPSAHCKNKWSKVWGSCHGLILIEDRRRSMFLLNPVTLEYKRLPLLPSRYRAKFNTCNLFGFGYDFHRDDYVVVAICYKNYPKEDAMTVYIYTLKTKQWKEAGLSISDFRIHSAGIYVGEFIYWLAESVGNSTWLVAAFDIANKNFSMLSLPEGNFQQNLEFQRLGIYEGCLCLINVNLYTDNIVELWVMKNAEFRSCIKSIVARNNYACSLPLEDNLVVLEYEGDILLISTSKCRMCMYLKAIGLSHYFIVGMSFVESLVSPIDEDEYKKNRRRSRIIQSFK